MASNSTHQPPPQKNLPNNTRVCALIDEENSCQLEDHIHDEFLPHEASSILGLPLNHCRTTDKPIWSANKNGIYSTKIAYQLLSNVEKMLNRVPQIQMLTSLFGNKFGHSMSQAKSTFHLEGDEQRINGRPYLQTVHNNDE